MQATDAVIAYLSAVGAREVPAQIRCREETQKHPAAIMQIAPEQGAFLQVLAKLMGAKRYLEIGVFTGYSALSVALALPKDGHVVALDVNREFTDLAQGYWKEAGVASKIDLRIGPAVEALDAMIADGVPPFDFVFIDADKPAYDAYYERALKLLRPGGLIALDNALLFGMVADEVEHLADAQRPARPERQGPGRRQGRHGARHRRRRRDAGGQALISALATIA